MSEAIRAEYYNDLASKISEFRSCGTFCDIDVHVGDKVFHCHRVILCSASEYFRIMLDGNFSESSSPEVVLRELEADVFEELVKFIYTGRAAINLSNLYDTIRAADFYKIPRLVEHCVVFIRENLNALAQDIWKIFLYVQSVGIKQIVEILGRHIRENFGYFSNAPEFVELSIDILLEILGVGAEDRTVLLCQDLLFEGIYTWIMHQENLNPDEKKSYFDRLFEKIDLSRLSKQYTTVKLPERMAVLTSLSESTDRSIPTSGMVHSCPKLLRAYVSILSKDRSSSMGTMIFSGFSSSYPSSWMYSGKVVDCYSEYMENIVIEDRLYSLGYSSGPHTGKEPQQTFKCSTSASMYPYTSLSLPPFVTDMCDMRGTANDIYLYNKCGPYSFVGKPNHSLYFYKRDIDTWFPLPSPKVNVSFASMTCDKGRVYLIGGRTSRNVVQAYDVRTREWSELPCTKHDYFAAGCCMYDQEIYLLNGQCSPYGEIYDPILGRSRPLMDVNDPIYFPKLVNYSDTLVNYYRIQTAEEFKISQLYTANGRRTWVPLPCLNDAYKSVKNIIPDAYSNLGLLDMVTF